ncbi:MAG: aminodeoxychorismate/anthranilate synthase component II [Ignavibacteriae bacterium]|nr:aminodeoxychorismate/anthranilate synthase component II [Ignavibacteriota bacterium]NOG97442.1 aminodeoxychorismate/anthranilate synthase component II [Ignavibacteriota bacterium]
MKVLIIDNYDSFTYNLVQLVGKFVNDIEVYRNDKITVDEIKNIAPDKIIISPGPGKPQDSKISLDVIKSLGTETPILGVCLGHQGIGISFGCKIKHAPTLMHGKTSKIFHNEKTIFKNLPQGFAAGRYHSLVIDKTTVQDELEITAETEDKVIMGVRHTRYPIEGIQFHPESILTPDGATIINNWLEL